MSAQQELRLLLSAGRGPQECAWAVTELVRALEQEAALLGVTVRHLDEVPGAVRGTHLSVLLQLSGPEVLGFARSWSGTLCWQAPSPYRPGVGRKNWYVVAELHGADADRTVFSVGDVDLVPCRTGGPGGQHRDKASTAVRATYRPTGAVVVVDTERRLSDNKRLALTLLRQQVENSDAEVERAAGAARWRTHDQLVRGNPTRTERP
ncbi:MAG TPA: peptide chain release factor H [Kineosporiaceae bacterium]|nr:peptide chain release factor H [Kineosporiaceae bacterium]